MIITCVSVNVLHASHMCVILSTLQHISISNIYVYSIQIILVVLVCYCALLDCESFIQVELVPLLFMCGTHAFL